MAIQTVVATMQQGVLMAAFQPTNTDRQLQSLNIIGPKSSLDVWIGSYGDAASHVDTTPHGDQNSTEYLYPKLIISGTRLLITWATGLATDLAYATADLITLRNT